MANPKVATIVPLHHLELLNDDEYFLALSHAAENSMYLRFFREWAEQGKYIILDNSAVELEEPEPFGHYLEKALSMGASEILLPDHFRNPERTLDAAWAAMAALENTGYTGRIMVVPQGKTVFEWLRNAVELLDVRSVDDTHGLRTVTTVGISCRYTDMFDGNRTNAFTLLKDHFTKFTGRFRVHFLGCYADPREEIAPIIYNPSVQGVDSSYPSVYAQHNIVLNQQAFTMPRPARHIDFLQHTYDPLLLAYNVDMWRDACLGEI